MVQGLSPTAISQQKAVTQDKELSSGLLLPRGGGTVQEKGQLASSSLRQATAWLTPGNCWKYSYSSSELQTKQA